MNGRVEARIHGRVQGVGFRWAARQKALQLGLNGWVRNRADGGVETVAEGPAEALKGFVEWLHRGPDGASVSAVAIRDTDARGESGFQIR